MALIGCKECGHAVSSSADFCPHCGAKTKTGLMREEVKAEAKGQLVAYIFYIVLIVAGAILFFTTIGEVLDHADRFLRWLQYGDGAFWTFIKCDMGFTFLLIGVIGMVKLARTLKNETISPELTVSFSEQRWKCSCGRINESYSSICLGCGARAPEWKNTQIRSTGGYNQNNLPAWKRVELQKKQAEENEENQGPASSNT